MFVLVHGPVPLPRNVEDLTEIHVRPYFGPFGIEIPIDGRTKLVGRLLVIILFKEELANAVMRKRAVLIYFQRLFEFSNSARGVIHFFELLPTFVGFERQKIIQCFVEAGNIG